MSRRRPRNTLAVQTISIAVFSAMPVLACLNLPSDLEEPAGARSAPTTPNELVAAYVEAIGGEKAVRKIKHRRIEARIVFKPQENCEEEDENCLT
jgi:hypothetical protein